MNHYGDLIERAWEWNKLMQEMNYFNHCGAFYQPKRSIKIRNKRRRKRKCCM